MNMRSLRSPILIVAISLVALFGLLRQRQVLEDLRTGISSRKQSADVAGESGDQRVSALTPPERSSPDGTEDISLSSADLQIIDEIRKDYESVKDGRSFPLPIDLENKIKSLDVATLKRLIPSLAPPTDPAERHLYPEIGIRIETILLGRLVEADPAYVLDILRQKNRVMAPSTMRNAVRHLAKTDPGAARNWLTTFYLTDEHHNQPYPRNNAYGAYLQGLSTTDMGQALQDFAQLLQSGELSKAEGIPEESLPIRFLEKMTSSASTPEMRQAIRGHLEEVEDLEDRARIRAALVRGVLNREGFEAAVDQFAEEFSGTDDEARAGAIATIATEAILGGDGERIGAWVLDEAPPAQRDAALRQFVGRWIDTDYSAAAAWIGNIDSGPAKDAAIELLAAKVEQFDPEGARVWREEIGR